MDGRASVLPASRRNLTEAGVVLAIYFALSLATRWMPAAFLLVAAIGLLLPPIWAAIAHDWTRTGFTRTNLRPALGLGAAVGLAAAAYVLLTMRDPTDSPPPMVGLQLAVGVPVWLLILSPLQEFLFRGWVQPRLTDALGPAAGLVATSVLFTLWHFLPAFEGTPTSSIDVSSVSGVLTMLSMGLAFGWAFRRTGNIAAPWLAHALMGLGTILAGGMTLVQVGP